MARCDQCGQGHEPGTACPGPSTLPFAEDPLRDGLLGGKYRVVDLIGEGGMGRVYLGEDSRLGRKVAIKVLAEQLSTSPGYVARFEREARAAAATGHPNIVQVLDLGWTSDGRPFLAMELLEGRDLGEELKRVRKLPVPRAVDIVGQALFGLSAAHGVGVVHRDLKPENVFLARRPKTSWSDLDSPNAETGHDLVKVLDFGISRFIEPDSRSPQLTRTGTTIGTVYYMAPEQVRSARGVDGRADLYAAGVILYLCVSGRLPFTGDNAHSILHRVLTQPVPDPRGHAPELCAGLAEVLVRSMAKEPDERFQTAEDFLAALRPFRGAFARTPEHERGDRAWDLGPAPEPADQRSTVREGVRLREDETPTAPDEPADHPALAEPEPEAATLRGLGTEGPRSAPPEPEPRLAVASEPPWRRAAPQGAPGPSESTGVPPGRTPSVWPRDSSRRRDRAGPRAALAGTVVAVVAASAVLSVVATRDAGQREPATAVVRPASIAPADESGGDAEAAPSGGREPVVAPVPPVGEGDAAGGEVSSPAPPPGGTSGGGATDATGPAHPSGSSRTATADALERARSCLRRDDPRCCADALEAAPRTAEVRRLLARCREAAETPRGDREPARATSPTGPSPIVREPPPDPSAPGPRPGPGTPIVHEPPF